jgi:hypothetical protein
MSAIASATRLVVPVPCPIQLAAATDGHPCYALAGVATYVGDKGRAVLAATDGRMAALVPVETSGDAGDASGAVRITSSAAFKACKRRKGKPTPVLHVDDRGVATMYAATGEAQYLNMEGSFPPVAHVLPKPEHVSKYVAFGVNAALLADLVAALGSDGGCTILIDPENKRPMVVLPQDHNAPEGAIGVLMPLAVDGGKGDPSPAARERAVKAMSDAAGIVRAAEARKGGR